MTDVGMNLTGVTYWATSEPFIDRFKTSSPWKSNVTGTSVAVDEHGDPLAIPTGAANISTNFAVDPLSAGTDNHYILTYDGTATIRLAGAKILSAEPGKVVFELTRQDPWVSMSVTSLDTADPLHDIHVVRTDQLDLYNSGEIFNPAFVDMVSHWDTLRFMGWENTNTLSQVSWDSHSTISNATWNTGAAPDGVPIEVMVKLANEAHTDMWYNVPTTADDTYVENALAYIRDNLDPSLKVHVEYSNEVWNWGYDAATYAQNMANSLWGTDANHDGVISTTDKAENVQGGWMIYYGYRSAQIAEIAHDVFGDQATARLDTVLSAQATYPDLTTYYTIPGIARADLGSPADLFTEYAIAPYFGNELSRPATDADKATILAWAHSGQAGIDAAFHELEYGGSLSTDHSLASFANFYAKQGAIAQQYGMDLVAYEAGASLTSSAYTGDDRADVSAFFGKLLNDPRAGELYTQMVNDFAAAGGTLLTAMNDTGANATSGYWGVLDTIYDTSSPRYDALLAAAADAHDHESVSGGLGAEPPITDPTESLIGGTAGDDTLTGTDGDDILNGVAGADHMIGGAGNDVYMVDDPGDVVVENANGGIDTVTSSLAHYTLGNNVENLIFVGSDNVVGTGNKLDNVITAGSGDAMLSGLAGNDTLIGGAGNDTLDGGTGSDSLAGGEGNDTYIVDNAGDLVVEAANGGTDTVVTTLDAYTLTDNVENLTHSGSRAFSGTGNALDNVITAGDGRGTLLGLDGNDTLIGSAGADYLDGGAGDDSMSGGNGNDIYIVDSIGDTVIEAANAGIDEIRTTLDSFTLGANVERLTAIGTGSFTGTGNALDNIITAGDGPAHLYGLAGNDTLNGGNSDDYLDGGSGADRMIGGAGNDTYIVDNPADKIIENAGGGTDEVRTDLSSYTLPQNVEILTYTGTSHFRGVGNGQDNLITGGNNGNDIYGNGGNDTMIGGDASDMLSGGHLMVGGKGNDSYYVYNTDAQIIENAGEGNDIVYAYANYTLPDNIEILRLRGDAIDGTGNALDNKIEGNELANRLYGGAGDDTILAGEGNDSLWGGAGNDFLSAAGGDDVLNGGGGKDTLIGGTGADHFVFNPGDLTADPATTTTIRDFSRAEGDRIDLSAIDAVAGTPTNEAFTFLGTAAFTGHAGELHVESVGNHWMVLGDTNGDGVADLALSVGGNSGMLVASDFLL